jgi:NAD(P)-dependent dehydrogenase (short-subunit alcohol dehydrogenase family)
MFEISGRYLVMSNMDEHTPLFSQGDYKALVIGSGGAIGGAFVAAFHADANCAHVEVVSRQSGSCFDLLNDESIRAQASLSREKGPFEIIIDATGALNIHGVGPEKSLNGLNSDHLMQSMRVNAIGPALVMRHFSPLLAKGSSVYAKLSARVGSIADNKKGGWYGYRASKAALNMMLQTAAIELQRKNPTLRVVALQPGTVRSQLSEPYTSSQVHLLEPDESVLGMLTALKSLPAKTGAHFVDHKGSEIPW